ncbi:MAG: methyltransferase type 11 [Kofleriaceae bacterium]
MPSFTFMLRQEAQWLGSWLAAQPSETVFPLCNIGSSTQRFRSVTQPWIDEHLFAGARAAGRSVIHVDRKPEAGVDLVGDVCDPSFVAELEHRRVRTVLCSNLLEHVDDVVGVCGALWNLVPARGNLVISGPYRYPLHPDPIDNGLRASPDELAALFPGAQVIDAALIEDGTFARYLMRSPLVALDELASVFTFWRGQRWIANLRRWSWLHRRFVAAAVILRKPALSA